MLSDRRESPWDETKHLVLRFFTSFRMTSIFNFAFLIATYLNIPISKDNPCDLTSLINDGITPVAPKSPSTLPVASIPVCL